MLAFRTNVSPSDYLCTYQTVFVFDFSGFSQNFYVAVEVIHI